MNNLCSYYLIGFLLLFILTNCSFDNNSNDDSTYENFKNQTSVDVSDRSILTNVQLSKYLNLSEIVVLDKSEFITSPKKVLATQNYIFLLDKKFSNKFIAYDRKGNKLWSIEVPYVQNIRIESIDDFDYRMDSGEIILWDNYLQKLIKFDLNGNFINETEVNMLGSRIAVKDSNSVIFFTNVFLPELNECCIYAEVDIKQGGIKSQIMRIHPVEQNVSLSSRIPLFKDIYTDKIYFSFPTRNKLFVYANSDLISYTLSGFSDVSDESASNNTGEDLVDYFLFNKEKFSNIENLFERNNKFYFTAYSPFEKRFVNFNYDINSGKLEQVKLDDDLFCGSFSSSFKGVSLTGEIIHQVLPEYLQSMYDTNSCPKVTQEMLESNNPILIFVNY